MVEGDKIYVMFENARAAIYSLKNRKFNGGKTLKIEGLDDSRL